MFFLFPYPVLIFTPNVHISSFYFISHHLSDNHEFSITNNRLKLEAELKMLCLQNLNFILTIKNGIITVEKDPVA